MIDATNKFAPVPQGRTLTIMPTYKCTAACEHCGTLSSPSEKTWLSLEHMISAIDQAAASGYRVVVFTGGEPTLAGKNLLAAIGHARGYGLTTRIVSNAHWAATDSLANRMVSLLVDSGLVEINFSTGDQHARFVPLDNIIRATRAAAAAPFNAIVIMVETVLERTITASVLEERADFVEIRLSHPKMRIDVLESPWMPLESDRVNSYQKGTTTNRDNVALRTGCTSILSTTAVQADGRIAACCGLGMRTIPELQVGNIAEDSIADADTNASNDFLKHWLRVEGPERILAWASEHDTDIKWENMYAHRCQACLRLYRDPAVRKVISERYHEKVADVIAGEWLLYDYSRPKTAAIEPDA